MKRTLIQFDDETHRKLRQQAFRQERSVASLVRELVAKGLAGDAAPRLPARAGQLLSVAAGRSRQGRLSPVSERHDEALGPALRR